MSAPTTSPVARLDPSRRPDVPDPAGFKKADAGKAPISLLPPDVLIELAHTYRVGAEKYGVRNMELGADWSRYYDAAMRHLLAWWGGEEYDPDNGQPHLMAAAFSIFTLRWYQLHERGEDDRPPVVEPQESA